MATNETKGTLAVARDPFTSEYRSQVDDEFRDSIQFNPGALDGILPRPAFALQYGRRHGSLLAGGCNQGCTRGCTRCAERPRLPARQVRTSWATCAS